MTDLSAADRDILRQADRIKRDIRRTKAKIRKASKVKRDKAQNLDVARAALQGVEAKFRKPRERDNEHLQYVRRAPCVACLVLGEEQTTPTRAAHIRCSYPEAGWPYTGKAEKPSDWRCGPLCDTHHTDGPNAQHRTSERDWWQRLGIYPPDLCAALVAARAAGADPAETVEQIASKARRNSAQEG